MAFCPKKAFFAAPYGLYTGSTEAISLVVVARVTFITCSNFLLHSAAPKTRASLDPSAVMAFGSEKAHFIL